MRDGLDEEAVVMVSDILPTGYMGAEMCDIEPGDVVAVWGAGPVGQFAIASALLLGAERVIAPTASRTASPWRARTVGRRRSTTRTPT